jgi:hypothetical protein
MKVLLLMQSDCESTSALPNSFKTLSFFLDFSKFRACYFEGSCDHTHFCQLLGLHMELHFRIVSFKVTIFIKIEPSYLQSFHGSISSIFSLSLTLNPKSFIELTIDLVFKIFNFFFLYSIVFYITKNLNDDEISLQYKQILGHYSHKPLSYTLQLKIRRFFWNYLSSRPN